MSCGYIFTVPYEELLQILDEQGKGSRSSIFPRVTVYVFYEPKDLVQDYYRYWSGEKGTKKQIQEWYRKQTVQQGTLVKLYVTKWTVVGEVVFGTKKEFLLLQNARNDPWLKYKDLQRRCEKEYPPPLKVSLPVHVQPFHSV